MERSAVTLSVPRKIPPPTRECAEHETLNWIGFYNTERLHEELGDIPPA